MILTLIKFLLLIFPISSAITTKFKYHQEESILITYLLTLIAFYILGLVNLLNIGLYLLIVVAIIATIYDIYAIIKKKIEISKLITIPSVIYVIFLCIISLYLKGNNFHDWDELSHWGTNLKFMVSKNLLWANKEFNGIHIVYQPLIGIAEWFINKLNGGFAEDISYLGYEIFICTLILPLLRNLKYNIRDVFKCVSIFIFMLLVRLLFGFPLITIYIDYALAVLFGISFYIAIKLENKKDRFLLMILLVALVLLKDTGLLFAGIVLMYLFIYKVIINIFIQKKISKELVKKACFIICGVFILIFVFMTWKIYCRTNGKILDVGHDHNYISQNLDIKSLIKAIFQSTSTEGKLNIISDSFFEYLTKNDLIRVFINLTPLKIIIIINCISIYLYKITNKEKKERILSMIISFNIGFILYLLLLLVTYLFAMTDLEGYRLASIDRYLNTYFLAWIIAIFMLLFENKNNNILQIFIICLVLFGEINIKSITTNYPNPNSSQELIEITKNIKNNISEDDKIYLIVQNSSQKFIQHQVRYLLSPIFTNDMSEFSLGEKYDKYDYDSIDITVQEWEEKLIQEEYNYVFIVEGDEKFYNKYKDIFENSGNSIEDIQKKLFKVKKITDSRVKLVEERI